MIETFPNDSLFIKEDTRVRRWAIPYHYEALNSRVENLIINHKDVIKDKHILDLGCHFGSFSYACLQQGAAFVHGVDSESKLIVQGKELFKKYHVPKEFWHFKTGDVIKVMEEMPENSVDTVLCLGIFYYLNDPLYALKLMAKVAKKAIILDTFTAYYAATVAKDRERFLQGVSEQTFELPMVYYPLTKSQKKDYTLKRSTENDKGLDLSLLALPTIPALEQFFKIAGLKAIQLSWNDYISGNAKDWQVFGDQAVKRASHWADLYANQIRAAYLLEHH